MRSSLAAKLAALCFLALLAPLQSVLAAACPPPPQAVHAQCPDHSQEQNGGSQHLCGCCCIVAMDNAAPRFQVPRTPAPALAPPALSPFYHLAGDRLDRPPR